MSLLVFISIFPAYSVFRLSRPSLAMFLLSVFFLFPPLPIMSLCLLCSSTFYDFLLVMVLWLRRATVFCLSGLLSASFVFAFLVLLPGTGSALAGFLSVFFLSHINFAGISAFYSFPFFFYRSLCSEHKQK